MTPPCLIFVYNAQAGVFAGMLDSIHKAVSPSTYPCGLCAITHGSLTMDRRWRDWLRSLTIETRFHHRPDFRAAWPAARDWPLPLVALARDGALTPLIEAGGFAGIASPAALAARIADRLATLHPGVPLR